MEFLFMVDMYRIFLLEMEIYSQDRFQTLSLQTNWIFLIIEIYIFGKNWPNQIKDSNSVKNKIKLDNLKNNGKKKNLRGYF